MNLTFLPCDFSFLYVWERGAGRYPTLIFQRTWMTTKGTPFSIKICQIACQLPPSSGFNAMSRSAVSFIIHHDDDNDHRHHHHHLFPFSFWDTFHCYQVDLFLASKFFTSLVLKSVQISNPVAAGLCPAIDSISFQV